MLREKNWIAYEEFLKRWGDRSVMDSDPIVLLVRGKASKAIGWGWTDWVEDLVQDTLLQLSKGQYRGEGPFEGYVSRIMGHAIIRLWRKEDNNRWTEMPDNLEEDRDLKVEIEMSELTQRLIARSPKHLWWYIEAIVEADGYLSEQEAADKGKVTRHQIGKLKKQLRRIWKAMESEAESTDRAIAKTAGEGTSS